MSSADSVVERTAPDIAVVADDLASALDGAAPFVASGAVTQAVVCLGDPPPSNATGLIAVDGHSRAGDETDAAQVTAAVISRLAGASVLIKTIDSTLRGHVLAEVGAAWTASRRRLVVVAPAFPHAGRVTRCGVQLVDGRDVAQSSFGNDARHPARTGDLSVLLAQLAPLVWRAGDGPWPDSGLIVADAESDADLDAVAGAGADADVLWVGSPGLAAALARRRRPRAPDARLDTIAPVRRIAVVVGSRHEINHAQISRLVTQGHPRELVLRAPDSTNPFDPGQARRVRTALAARAAALVHSGEVDGIIATGGETTRAVADALGCEHLTVLGEPMPGVVVALCPKTGVTLASKAGGFGDANTLARLHALLTGRVTA